MEVSTANNSLRVLRRILNLAVEWGVLEITPKLKILPGESCRERVISLDEEARYLAAVTEPLARLLPSWPTRGCAPKSASCVAGTI